MATAVSRGDARARLSRVRDDQLPRKDVEPTRSMSKLRPVGNRFLERVPARVKPTPGETSWKLDIYSQGIEVAGRLAESIDGQVRIALAGLGRRVLRVHVRLYGMAGGCVCYIRVDMAIRTGFARGDSADDAAGAARRACARIGAVAAALSGDSSLTPNERGTS